MLNRPLTGGFWNLSGAENNRKDLGMMTNSKIESVPACHIRLSER